MNKTAKMFGLFFILPVVIFIAGCERSTDPHDNGHRDMEEVRIIDRTQTARPVIATWTHDDGWEFIEYADAIYELSKSAEEDRTRVSLGVEIYDHNGDQIELDEAGEYQVRYWIAEGAQEGVIDISLDEDILFHGDHVHIYGLEVGETEVEFILWHGDHADAVTDPAPFKVVE